MKFKPYQYYKELPAWAKGVTVVGLLVVTYIAGRGLYDRVQSGLEKSKSKKSLKNVAEEKKDLKKTGLTPTYSITQYKGWADAIVKQFDGCDFSTPMPIFPGLDLSYSGKKLYEILEKMQHDLDFLELVDAFGVKTYDECGWFTGDVENVTLYAAVTHELTNGEIKIINDLLKKKGITYAF